VSFTVSTEFQMQHCIECGCPMPLTPEFVNYRRKSHRNFYCPNGHVQSYAQETEEEKAKRMLRERDVQLMHERDQHRAARQELDRMTTRIAKGVCPKCNRQFVNVKRHMACKHAVTS
jgi:hypothetical protein